MLRSKSHPCSPTCFALDELLIELLLGIHCAGEGPSAACVTGHVGCWLESTVTDADKLRIKGDAPHRDVFCRVVASRVKSRG